MSPIKVAIIGYGAAGACFHVPILKDLNAFTIVAVVSSRPDEVRCDLPETAVFPDVATMLAASDAELCVVATLNELHAPVARACLDAGRHVVVEKPFVIDPADGRALEALATDKRRVLAVYHSRGWDGDFLTLKRLVADGRIGRPHTLISHYDRWRPKIQDRWRERPGPGSGILWDLGSHLIHQAIELLGPAKTVFSQVATTRPGATVTDHFHLVVEHADGATSILHGDCQTLSPGPRFILHGDRASYVKYEMDGQEALLRRKLGPATAGWGIDCQENWGTLTEPDATGEVRTVTVPSDQGCYQTFYETMARAMRNGTPPPVSAATALDVVEVILAAERSAEVGRRIAISHGQQGFLLA